MMLDEIGTYIAASSASFVHKLTRGLNIFEGFIPKDPEICVGLFEVPGEAPLRSFVKGIDGVVFERPRLEVQVRDVTYEDARLLANQIYGLLEGRGNEKFPNSSGTLYASILSLLPPKMLNRLPDEQLLNTVTINQIFQVTRKWSAE